MLVLPWDGATEPLGPHQHTHVLMPFFCIQGLFMIALPRTAKDLQVFWVMGPVELPACLLGTEPWAWDLSQPGQRGLPPRAAVRRKM